MKREKIYVLAIMFVLTIFCEALIASPFTISYIPRGASKAVAKEKSTGNPLWSSIYDFETNNYKGKTFVHIKETGSGIWGSDKTYKTWEIQSYFYMDNGWIKPYQIKMTLKDRSGKVVRYLVKDFDEKTGKVLCKENGAVKQFDLDQDLVDNEDINVCLENFDFENKKSVIFHFLTKEPALYKFTANLLGKETVSINGENIECYKVQLIPDLGAANIFGAFVPKTYMWMNAKAPHDFVKYEGLESGLGTPYIDIEAVK